MTGIDEIDPTFGQLALPYPLERLRRFGCALPANKAARIVSSGIRRLCLAGRADPIDVEPFPGQKARLHPRDNLSEKRVFSASQFWDTKERAALADAIAAAERSRPYIFVDIGANAGLYTLFARSIAEAEGRAFNALAVEPDPTTCARLQANMTASGASDVQVAQVAIAREDGEARLEAHDDNRGQAALGTSGVLVRTTPLASALHDAGFDRVDAMKIDIEGGEMAALEPFFAAAPQSLWPDLMIVEAFEGSASPAVDLCAAHGYQTVLQARMNAVLRRTQPAEQV